MKATSCASKTQGHTGPVVQPTMGYTVTEEHQAVLYHVTNHLNFSSIAENGLICNMERRTECFFNVFTPNGATTVENRAMVAPTCFAQVERWPYKWERNARRDVYVTVDVAKNVRTRMGICAKAKLRDSVPRMYRLVAL